MRYNWIEIGWSRIRAEQFEHPRTASQLSNAFVSIDTASLKLSSTQDMVCAPRPDNEAVTQRIGMVVIILKSPAGPAKAAR
jgi:hypothetical protein